MAGISRARSLIQLLPLTRRPPELAGAGFTMMFRCPSLDTGVVGVSPAGAVGVAGAAVPEGLEVEGSEVTVVTATVVTGAAVVVGAAVVTGGRVVGGAGQVRGSVSLTQA